MSAWPEAKVMHVLCGELRTREEIAVALASIAEEIRLLESLVRRMKAGENVDALLETIMPMIEKLERLEAQRDALLAARDGEMH
jgi:hypothetical protein